MGRRARLARCTVDGNLTDNAGNLSSAPSANVRGNVQISAASAFNLGPGAKIDGNLQIQTPGRAGHGLRHQVKGNLAVKNNLSPIEIGETARAAELRRQYGQRQSAVHGQHPGADVRLKHGVRAQPMLWLTA